MDTRTAGPGHLPLFDGVTFNRHRDGLRLEGQLRRVYETMADGQWRTLAELAAEVKGSEAGVSARLRDLRKPRFGAYTIEREHVGNGLWRYRLSIK